MLHTISILKANSFSKDNGVLQRLSKELGAITQWLNSSVISLQVLKLGYVYSPHWISIGATDVRPKCCHYSLQIAKPCKFNAPGSRIIKVMRR